jgi:hypothetical protein
MSAENESPAQKQARLSAEIARQRTQLAAAYRDIAKPVLYTEYGLRGMGFLRQNPWVLTVIPASLSTTTSLIALVRYFFPGKAEPRKTKWFGRAERDAERDAKREVKRGKKTLTDHAMKWGGHGWKVFKLYRRARKFLS